MPLQANNNIIDPNQIRESSQPIHSDNHLIRQQPLVSSSGKAISIPKKLKLVLLASFIIFLVFITIIVITTLLSKGNNVIALPQQITLNIWTRSPDESTMRSLIAEFESENPNVKINYQDRSDTLYKDILKERLLQGDPTVLPDIVEIEEAWLDEIHPYLLSIPLEPTIIDRFSEASLTNNKYGVDLKALPFKFDSLILAYNQTHLAELGLTENDFIRLDWPFLLDRADRLTQRETTTLSNGTKQVSIKRSGLSIGSPEYVRNAAEILQMLLIQNDTLIYTPVERKFFINSSFIDMVEFYTSFRSKNIWDDSLGDNLNAFVSGKVSMILLRSNGIKTLLDSGTNLDFVTVLPAKIGSIRNISLSSSLAIPYTSSNYAYAVQFLEFISRTENGNILYNSKGFEAFIPAQVESQKQIPDNSPYAVFSDINPTSYRLISPNYERTTEAFTSYLTDLYAKNERNFLMNQPLQIDQGSLLTKLNALIPTIRPLPTQQ